MAANSAAPPKGKKPVTIPPALVVILVVLAAGLAGFLYLNKESKKPPPEPPPLTGAAKDYVHNRFLPITDSKMEAHESYLKQQILEITGKIGNTGDRVVDVVVITCVFRDPEGQEVFRERIPIVKHGSHLSPGDVREFRLPFDNIPETWNQAMPDMYIAQIEFA